MRKIRKKSSDCCDVKFLHTADLHVGNYRYADYDEIIDLLFEINQCALDEKCDFVLFCGDMFRHRSPQRKIYDDTILALQKINYTGMPWYIIPGNHCFDTAAGIGGSHSLELIYEFNEFNNIIIKDHVGTIRVRNYLILCIPYTNQKEKIYEAAKSIKELYSDERIIVAAHFTAVGSMMDNGFLAKDGVLIDEFDVDCVDYIALGHIHKRQKIKGINTMGYYCGSPLMLDWGETGIEKGWNIVNIKNGEANVKFVESSFRKLIDISYNVDEHQLSCQNGISYNNSIVRLTINGNIVDLPKSVNKFIEHVVDGARKLIIVRCVDDNEQAMINDITITSLINNDLFNYVDSFNFKHKKELKRKIEYYLNLADGCDNEIA